MILYAFALIFVSAAAAQKRCCQPDQFEGYIGLMVGGVGPTGKMYATELSGTISMDANRKMTSMTLSVYYNNTVVYKEHLLTDYANKVLYNLNMLTNKCAKSAVTDEFIHCIPKEAVYNGRYQLGGEQKIVVDIWKVKQDADDITATVNADNCSVFSELVLHGDEMQSTMTTIGFTNTRFIVADPSVFDVPPQCTQPVHEYSTAEQLLKRHNKEVQYLARRFSRRT